MYAKSNHMVWTFVKTKYKTDHSVAYDSRAASASAGCSGNPHAVRENDDDRIVL